jgi:hypothetical protein
MAHLSPRIVHQARVTRVDQRVQTITKRESKTKLKYASYSSYNNISPPNLHRNYPTVVHRSVASAVVRILDKMKTPLLYLY